MSLPPDTDAERTSYKSRGQGELFYRMPKINHANPFD